ncbi:MAG: hybrid sensor histidine kinase/response regulator, partial [Elusimicrobia bacterium]|nr:hybrid sensor histidine kinase/response regulator [Elusimicrobiota bacterium]
MRRLRNVSVRTKLYAIVALMVLDVAALLAAGAFGMWALSDLRAYVGGEGLWAKSQKDAVVDLQRYARSRDEADYRAYEAALAVPLGDHRARLALQQVPPDLEGADAGFLAGGNHPDDVRGMSLLFLRFRRVRYIAEAIVIWGRADALLVELQGLGEALHARVRARRPADGLLRRVDEVNGRL